MDEQNRLVSYPLFPCSKINNFVVSPKEVSNKELNKNLTAPVIAEQMAIAAEFSDGFLHLQSGNIFRLNEFETHSEFLPLIEAGELHLIPTITSQDLYLWMKEFTATIPDAELQKTLNIALEKIGGVWKFRNVLYPLPEMEREWELFFKNKLLAQATEWLQTVL